MAYSEIGLEQYPVMDNEAEHNRSWLVNRHKPRDFSSVEECQQVLQEGHPTFVPTFSDLRRKCLTLASQELKVVEQRIASSTGPEQQEAIKDATNKLREFDMQLNTAIDRYQLEDPDYAEQRGLAVYSFTIDSGEKTGDWMLLASNWGRTAKSIVDSDPPNVRHRRWMQEFNDDRMPSVVAFKRRKTTLERQWRALKEDHDTGILMRDENMIRVWALLLGLGFLCLVAFLAVGIIASTTTFSTTFIKTFFWIAIVWTVISSSLLGALMKSLGGNGRDIVGACLAAVAIWLVVIQIGQTKLSSQASTDQAP